MESSELALRVQRLQRLLWLALVLALLPWCAFGAAAWYLTRERIEWPGVLCAGSFEVRSPSGVTLAELGAAPRIGGALRLHNADGRDVAYLGTEPAGGGNLSLRAKDGKILVVARDNDGHRGSVTAYGANEKPLALMGAGMRDDGVLQVWNASGGTIGSLATNQFGEPLLQLTAKDGHTALAVGTRAEGQTDIVLYGPNGKAGAMLAAEAQGGHLGVYDVRGVERVQAASCADQDTAHVSILDTHGDWMAMIGQQIEPQGGYFRAFSSGEHVAFYAGVDDQGGSGRISLYHPSGSRLFAACEAEDRLGCILYTSAIDGTPTFIAPEQPLGGK